MAGCGMQSHSGRSIGNVDLLFTDFNYCLCRGADEMICSGTRPIQELPHQVLGKGQKLVLDFGDHQVGYVSFTIDARGSHFDAPAYIRLTIRGASL